MVWYGATALSHLAFNAADSMRAFCTPSKEPKPVDTGAPQLAAEFDTSSACAATGLTVRAGFRYEIVVTMNEDEPWEDDGGSATPSGYRTSTMKGFEKARSYATILLRRILFRPWYRLIARAGDTGVDEYFLDPIPVTNSNPQAYRDTFKPNRSGEVFLYVNDAVIGLPWVYDWFYRGPHHSGKAKVTMKVL